MKQRAAVRHQTLEGSTWEGGDLGFDHNVSVMTPKAEVVKIKVDKLTDIWIKDLSPSKK